MQPVLQRRVFSVADRTFTWGEVIDWAVTRGDWKAISRRAGTGLACARRADRSRDGIDPGELERAANAFRRQHKLRAAEEMDAWLAEWGLEVEGWLEWVRRSLLVERGFGHQADIEAPAPSWADEWVEAVCSGELHRFARALAERVAAQERFSGRVPEAGENAEIETALERLRDEVLTPEAVEREVATQWLEWTRVDCRCVTAGEEDVARELALCVREDGLDLAELATGAGMQVEERSWYLDQTEPIGEPLLGARPGELLGPVPVERGVLLCFVVARVTPNAAEPVVRERANTRIACRAVEREVATRVRWHQDTGHSPADAQRTT